MSGGSKGQIYLGTAQCSLHVPLGTFLGNPAWPNGHVRALGMPQAMRAMAKLGQHSGSHGGISGHEKHVLNDPEW